MKDGMNGSMGRKPFGMPAHPKREESMAEMLRRIDTERLGEWTRQEIDSAVLEYCPDGLDAAVLRIDREKLRRRMAVLNRRIARIWAAGRPCEDMIRVMSEMQDRYREEAEVLGYAEALVEGM